MKLIGGEGFEYSKAVKTLCCALVNRFVIETQVCLDCGHAYLEQGSVESDLHACSVCKEEFRSNKPLVCSPLAVFRPRLVGGHLCFEGTD